jgi:GntR family transcriptional regulator / MocR family aminotransferase
MLLIDRNAPEPLTTQIHGRLRDMILAGTLPAGARMSSTRAMARELGVSRNIVLNAFDQLAAEGFFASRRGAGTFVAPGAALPSGQSPDLSAIHARGFRPFRADCVDFRSGIPELARFPVSTWQRLSREVWGALTPLDLSYGQPEGRVELRAEIAAYIASNRGVRCHPEQVIVTSGTTQAIGIVSRLLIHGARSICLLEDPITSDIVRIVAGHGGRVVPVPVDNQGMSTKALPKSGNPAFLYATPSHQYPLGVTLPIQRRVVLVDYARSRKTYIVEDDYDSELRFESPPIEAIQGLDPERVVYLGTFSKTLCPALRIGYIVLPPALVDRGREAKWFSDLHCASVDQLVLARFICDGHFLRHVHAMKKLYRARRDVLVDALLRRFGRSAEVLGSAAGLHLCARFRGVRFTPKLVAALERDGVRIYPVAEHAIREGTWEDTLVFGYGMLDGARLEEGVALLSRGLARARARRAT